VTLIIAKSNGIPSSLLDPYIMPLPKVVLLVWKRKMTWLKIALYTMQCNWYNYFLCWAIPRFLNIRCLREKTQLGVVEIQLVALDYCLWMKGIWTTIPIQISETLVSKYSVFSIVASSIYFFMNLEQVSSFCLCNWPRRLQLYSVANSMESWFNPWPCNRVSSWCTPAKEIIFLCGLKILIWQGWWRHWLYCARLWF